jgi:oligoendopeptidase F
MSQVLERDQIPEQFTWDTVSVYPTYEAWEAAISAAEGRITALSARQGTLAGGAAVVLSLLEDLQVLQAQVQRVNVYTTMFYEVNTADQRAGAMRDRAQGLWARFAAGAAFVEPELLTIGTGTLLDWAATDEGLGRYRHYFERLETRAPHVRSAEVEQLLGALRQPFSSANAVHGVLANSEMPLGTVEDSAGNPHDLTQGTVGALVNHADAVLRRNAWTRYADAHLALQNTMAQSLATGVKQDVFNARARRYSSSLDAALSSNHIPLDVFHNLIDTFKRNLPTWHRYWEVRRKALNPDGKLHVADARAPLAAPLAVSYQQAIDWICAGMQPLGDEYVRVMRDGLQEQRWVDVYPNRGKRAGAFSMGGPGTHPFIMMSYNDDIFSLSTLAHELGHSMHSYYTRRTQPVIFTNYGLFLAEVASNFNQAVVRDYLFNTLTGRDAQINVIEEAMANFHRYFFIMPTLARFELEVHERAEKGQPLTAPIMIDLMADLFSEAFGPSVEIDRPRVGSTWAQFSTHLYSNFYVYQYATGIAGAHALAEPILAGDAAAAERYIETFLKAGGSRFPLDTLRAAGVDLAAPEAVDRTFARMAGYVDRLAGLVAE